MRNRFWKGLKKSEITLGLSIAAILVLLVYLRFDNFKCRSMQSEAKFYLKEIYAAQMLFRADRARFATFTELIESKRVVIKDRYYTFIDTETPTPLSFAISAVGKKNCLVDKDTWSIDDKNVLKHELSTCGNK